MAGSGDLIVVTGPPGSGKSSVSSLLRADRHGPDHVLVSGDDFFDLLGDSMISPWLPEAHNQNEVVVEAAAAATGRFVRAGYTVVYDGMIGPWFVPNFLAAAGLATMHYVVLLPALHLCLERVRTRVGHGFGDPDATRHMYRDFADAHIDSRHVISDPPEHADELAALVRHRWAAGVLRRTAY